VRPARLDAVAAAGAVAALGVVYALVVPFGLPYDEPVHWLNVVHIADTGTLPRIGAPDVGYEAVQTPLTYVLDAALAAPLDALGASEETTQRLVRVLNVGWLLVLLFALAAVTRRLVPGISRGRSILAGALVSGSSIIVAVGSSVENDIAAAGLGVLALVQFIDAWDDPGWKRSGAAGLLLGVAFLAKPAVWPLGIVWVLALVVRRRPKQLAAFALLGLLVSGWWIVRNWVLYESLTGNNAVKANGDEWPPVGFHGVSSLVDYVRAAVTFLWLPVEYWRNTVSAPAWIEALVVVGTIGLLALLVLELRRQRLDGVRLLVLASATTAVLAWVFADVFVEGASFRLTYSGVLPLWAWAVAVAVSRGRPYAWALVAGLVVIHVFALASVA